MIGLSATAAAPLLGLSRQSLNEGIAPKRAKQDYFTARDLAILTAYAKRNDLPKLKGIYDFIENEYGWIGANFKPERLRPLIRDLLSPREVAFRQTLIACDRAKHIVVMCNETRAHLQQGAIFSRTLNQILINAAAKVDVVAPRKDWLNYLQPAPLRKPRSIHLYVREFWLASVPVVLAVDIEGMRGFAFSKLTVEELEPMDAMRLWKIASEAGVPERIAFDQSAFQEPRSEMTVMTSKKIEVPVQLI